MRIVFDTNVLIAAFAARGACDEVFEHCCRKHAIIVSDFILDEFEEKLVKKLKHSRETAHINRLMIMMKSKLVSPFAVEMKALRDKDDLQILGTAAACKAEVLITGDKELLSLRNFKQTPILPPSQFWAWEAGRAPISKQKKH